MGKEKRKVKSFSVSLNGRHELIETMTTGKNNAKENHIISLKV